MAVVRDPGESTVNKPGLGISFLAVSTRSRDGREEEDVR